MTRSERNKRTATEALKMVEASGRKIAIAVDDDERAGNMLRLIVKTSEALGIDIGSPNYGNGVITIPVADGEGELRIISADHLSQPGRRPLN